MLSADADTSDAELCTATTDVDCCTDSSPACDDVVKDTSVAGTSTSASESSTGCCTVDEDGTDELDGCGLSSDVGDFSANVSAVDTTGSEVDDKTSEL